MLSKILFRNHSIRQFLTKAPLIIEGKSIIKTDHKLLLKNNVEIITENKNRQKEVQDKLDQLLEHRLNIKNSKIEREKYKTELGIEQELYENNNGK